MPTDHFERVRELTNRLAEHDVCEALAPWVIETLCLRLAEEITRLEEQIIVLERDVNDLANELATNRESKP